MAPSPAPRTRRHVLVCFGLAALLFCGVEGLIFRSRLYLSILEPDSTAGSLQTFLGIEKQRYKPDPPQVVGVGDSRMGLEWRVADRLRPEVGYGFGRIATAGTHPRCWYYMLREVDPHARNYAAVLIPLNSYDDEDWENLADDEVDIHYLAPLLRVSDALEFSLSFEKPSLKWQAFRTTMFKGLAYKRDLEAYFADPRGRMARVEWNRTSAAQAHYNYIGDAQSMQGLEVDWQARKVTHYPETADTDVRNMLDNELLRETGTYTGQRTAYMRKWLGRIVSYYRGSQTRLIFFRLPRGPVVRPYVPYTPTSAVREIGARKEGILIDEHYFDVLERRENFKDAVHLNETGCEQFTTMLVREVRRILGPPKGH